MLKLCQGGGEVLLVVLTEMTTRSSVPCFFQVSFLVNLVCDLTGTSLHGHPNISTHLRRCGGRSTGICTSGYWNPTRPIHSSPGLTENRIV